MDAKKRLYGSFFCLEHGKGRERIFERKGGGGVFRRVKGVLAEALPGRGT